jgi:cardiolipin synthase
LRRPKLKLFNGAIRSAILKREPCGSNECSKGKSGLRVPLFMRMKITSVAKTQLQSFYAWIVVGVCILLQMAAISGCATIPDARAMMHERFFYRDPQFVGSHGPLSHAQGQAIIARLEASQHANTDILARHLAFEQAISSEPLVLGNKVTLLENGPNTYKAMLAAIRGARDNVNLEMYIISRGAVGNEFADALIERAHHGVQVNIIYDSFGSMQTSSAYFDRLRQNGIAVVQFNPMSPFEHRFRWHPTHRDHRKLLVVDGQLAFTGGINISEVYASGLSQKREPPQYWRDTDVEVEGPVVARFQQLFMNEWQTEHGPPLAPRNYFPKLERKGDQIVRVIGSVPEQFSLIYVTLISAISNAQTNVYITDAYFAPDHQMLHALANAARRGVDVRLLLPQESDEAMIVPAARSHYTYLLKAGVKIYEWRGAMLHAKTATIDGVWSTVGTSNLDWWSIARNNEINAVILGHDFSDQMNLMFRNDIEGSSQIDLHEWEERGFDERFKEFFARIASPIL